MNKPIELTLAEWKEISQLPVVREGWGLEDETPEEFAALAYAVKFHFHSGCPGYVGDLYILQGDALTGYPPLVFTREGGRLALQENDCN